MNILMMTNTYKPVVGGIERSIEVFSSEYRALGHKVLIVAPVFKNMKEEEGVYRIPAIQNFNGTDFSVELPVPGILDDVIDNFEPDIVHSHHPFLVGDTALRIASSRDIPLVFTYHTMYEMNTHYVPGNSKALRRFVAELALGYSQLCDRVIAPSGSILDILKHRGLDSPVTAIPTGINVSEFSSGDGDAFREKAGIPKDCFLAGYLGRMEEEKNMLFLLNGIIRFMKNNGSARFLAVGGGDLLEPLKKKAVSEGVPERTHFTGVLKGKDKIDAYHAMDVFAFASKSETQGLVLAEAMASGVPVIGLDAPGVRDIVRDGVNGFLLKEESLDNFSDALDRFRRMDNSGIDLFAKEAKATAEKFDFKENARKVLDVYKEVCGARLRDKDVHGGVWAASKRYIKAEMELVSNMFRSAGAALSPDKTGQG